MQIEIIPTEISLSFTDTFIHHSHSKKELFWASNITVV